MSVIAKTFPVGSFQCNCTILGDTDRGEAVVIDPGDDAEDIAGVLAELKLRPLAFLHTHAHIDHIGGTHELKVTLKGDIYLHEGDSWLYENVATQARMIGLAIPKMAPVDKKIKDGEGFNHPTLGLEFLHTPGHTPGSVCFCTTISGQPWIFSGDTLFQRSIGRTDLWGGDFDAIIASIKNRLLVRDGDSRVIPGHGPTTTIAEERRENPFLG